MSVKGAVKRIIKNTPIYRYLISTELYRRYAYNKFKNFRTSLLLQEAETEFKKLSVDGITMEDYKHAFEKSLCSFSEFMYQYEFWKLSEGERNEYVSRLEMRLWYERHKSPKIENLFWNKVNWLKYFDKYIHRSWLNVPDTTYEDFRSYFNPKKRYIAKPIEGSLGEGIFKIEFDDINQSLYYKLSKDRYVVEELVENEKTIKEFHPFSLNTIRVTTLGNGTIIWTFIRFGNNGNLVDNAHAGGIFARINPDTGIVDTDGIDTSGNCYEVHPYSRKRIRGFVVPRWNEIKQILSEMHRMVPEAQVIGWDVCVNKSNQIEIIEGNHLPDVDVAQSPAKEGIRRQLSSQLRAAGLPSLNE